jgi:hypothetical protein
MFRPRLAPLAVVVLTAAVAGGPAARRAVAAPTPRAALVASSAPSPTASPDPGAIDATTRWSEHHAFRVHYDSSPTPVPILIVHQWTVTIVAADGKPTTGALVTVLGGMPAHGHGLPTVPTVRELGGGRYLVEGLKFHMPGAWVVAFRIKAGTVVDSVSFALDLP